MSKSRVLKTNINSTHLVYVLLFIVPFIDLTNGIIQTAFSLSFSIGLVYRILTLIVCLYYLFRKSLDSFAALPIIFIAYLFLSIPFHFEANWIDDIRDAVTISSLPIIYLTICEINSKEPQINLSKLINWYCLAFPLTLVIPYFLKIGYSAYGDSGYRGFYIALNAISNTIVITSIISIYKIFRKRSIFNFVIFALNTFCILIMGTKSSYLLFLVSFVIFAIMFLFDKSVQLSKKILFLAIVVSGIVVFISLFWNKISSIFDRWDYFFNQRSFISFLTSARSDRIVPAFTFIRESEYSAVYFLFGYGNISNEFLEYYLIEMDFIDMFFSHGIIGLLLFLSIIVYLLSTIQTKKRVNKFIIVVFVLLSFFVGHVITNALSATILAVILACSDKKRIVLYKNRKHIVYRKKISMVSMFEP